MPSPRVCLCEKDSLAFPVANGETMSASMFQ